MRWDLDDLAGAALFSTLIACLVAGAIFGIVAITKAASSTGGIDFCVIEVAPPGYRLTGHRPWRSDVAVALTPSFDEAKRIADETACRLWNVQ